MASDPTCVERAEELLNSAVKRCIIICVVFTDPIVAIIYSFIISSNISLDQKLNICPCNDLCLVKIHYKCFAIEKMDKMCELF